MSFKRFLKGVFIKGCWITIRLINFHHQDNDIQNRLVLCISELSIRSASIFYEKLVKLTFQLQTFLEFFTFSQKILEFLH